MVLITDALTLTEDSLYKGDIDARGYFQEFVSDSEYFELVREKLRFDSVASES